MATKNKGQRPSERSMPTPSSTRLEKSRKLAQKRRETYKDLMTGIMESLPFSREVLSQLDYNSRLRLALCFFKMKSLLDHPKQSGPKMIEASPDSKSVIFQPGVVQELMIEAMDGFLIVLLSDGSIIYLSDSIHKHLGLFQSEHMGTSVYDLVLEEDHNEVKQALSIAETRVHTRLGTGRLTVACSFFCRMKCSRNKVANTQSKSPGFKVVHTSGHFRLQGSEAFLVALVKPVTPPSILEIRMEGNMFVTHYSLDMTCIFFDGRLNHLMGYKKDDLEKKPVFDFHHHDDTEATLECSKGIQARGEGMSGYYRMLTKHGQFVWLQTRASMMFDSHTGEPSYIVCMNFVINKDEGNRWLASRKALPPCCGLIDDTKVVISEERSKAHDPFPIPREDGIMVNPLGDECDPATGATKSPEVRVKVEKVNPPTTHEEPSSTTNLPGLARDSLSESVHERSPHLQDQVSSFHDITSPVFTSSASSECIPDSTTTVISQQPAGRIDSGYKSRNESTSSNSQLSSSTSGSVSTPCSISNSTGPSSIPHTPAVSLQDDGIFSETTFSRTDISIPMQPHTHSGSTSEPPHCSSVPQTSIYQDPVIHELPRQSENVALPTTSAQQLNPLQGFTRSQTANLSHYQPEMYFQQPTNAASSSPCVVQQQSLLGKNDAYPGQQPLDYHGDYTQPASIPHRVQLCFNPQVSQSVIMPELPSQLSACQFDNPPTAPVTTSTFSLYQYQIDQQHRQMQENRAFAPNFSFAHQQQPLQHHQQQQPPIQHHHHQQQNTGFMGTNPAQPAPIQSNVGTHSGMTYVTSSNRDRSSGFTNQAFLPNSIPLTLPSFDSVNEHFGILPPGQDVPQQDSLNTTQPSIPVTAFVASTTSVPLTHPQHFDAVPLTFGMDTMATRGASHVTNQVPGLVNLTGEDLRILEFIDQLDSGGSIRQLPTHSQHLV